ncbi:hypothetical protein D3C80_1621740 [compost metagenome]
MYVPSGFTTTVPFVGSVPFSVVSGSPSASLAVTLPVTGLFSSVDTGSAVTTGTSLTGVTVTSITTLVSPPLPSLIIISNESLPLKSASGV